VLWTYRPAEPLASYVEAFWCAEGDQAAHRHERVLPDGRFKLIIELADAWGGSPSASFPVVGMQTRYVVIDTKSLQSLLGVVFRPGGTGAFLDAPADAFLDRSIPLDLVWGSAAIELRTRLQEAASAAEKFWLLETALQQRLCRRLSEKPRGLHPAVRYALGEFEREPHIQRVLGVAKESGFSRRHLAQLFREEVGITPKLYCRLHRFQRVLRQIASGAPVNWTDVALAGGYSDQAHFNHEFRDFSGISPGAYLAGERPYVNHVVMD
jgi:AraC-like DNA-binding protein